MEKTAFHKVDYMNLNLFNYTFEKQERGDKA